MKSLSSTAYKFVAALMIVVLALSAMPVSPAYAAIATATAWTNIYHNAAMPGTIATQFSVAAGSNRMLVVALSYEASNSNGLTVGTVSYGGVAMTAATANDGGNNTSMHSLIYYLKDNAIMDGANHALVVGITGGGTPVMQNVWYSVYTGVDQVATPTSQNYNSGGANVTAAAFGTALATPAGYQAVLVGTAARAGGAVTVNAPANWTTNNNQASAVGRGIVGTFNGATATTTAPYTFTSSRWSQTGLSMAPAVPDVIPPTATIDLQTGSDSGTSNTDNITNVADPIFNVVFSETVTGLAATDFTNTGTATGCTFAVGAPAGNTYPVTVTGCSEGTLILRLAASGVADTAGNPNAQTDGPIVTIDRSAPTAVEVTPVTTPTTDPTPAYTFSSTEAGTVTYGGACSSATTSAVVGNNPISFNALASGTYSNCTVRVTDAAGNQSNLLAVTAFTVDATAPTVTIDHLLAGQADPTNILPINFRATFSEPINVGSFTVADITNGGTAPGTKTVIITEIAPNNGTTFNVEVDGLTGSGTVTITIAAGTFQDVPGNTNTVASINTNNSVTYDTGAPTVTNVTSSTANNLYNTGDTISIQVVFNEAVTVTGTPTLTLAIGGPGRAINYSSGSGTNTLTFNYLVVAGDASLDLDYLAANALALNGGTIRDAALNNATLTLAAPGATGSLGANKAIVIDTIAPTVTIVQAAGQADPASTQPITFTVTFSETVTGFTGADVTLSGTAGGFAGATKNITGTGSIYTVTINGLTGPGTVIAIIPANGVQDLAGNNNSASAGGDNSVTLSGFTITTTTGTGGTITPGTTTLLGGGSQDFNIAPNAGYIVQDVKVDALTGGGSVGSVNFYSFINVTANHTLEATFDPGWKQPSGFANNTNWGNPTGAYTSNNAYADSYNLLGNAASIDYNGFGYTIPAGSVIDGVEVAIEGQTPGLTLSVSVSPDGTNFPPPRTLAFTANDSTVRIGGPTDKWAWSWASVPNFTVRVIAPPPGLFGTGFTVDQVQVKVHYTLPRVTINQAVGQADPTNTSPINFTVVFPYPVTNFATGDVTLGGTTTGTLIGTVTQIAPNNGTTYNVAVTGMTGNGTVIASIAAGVATDVNGTPNTPSTSTDNIVTYDGTPPTATIDLLPVSDSGISSTDNLTNEASLDFEVNFSEVISGLTNGDFSNAGTATGCTFVVGTPTGNTYPLTVSGCSQGTLIPTLPAGAVTDTSGGQNALIDGLTVTIDRTGPDVTVEQAIGQADPTGASPINFTAVFTEVVYDFNDVLDVSLSGTASPTFATITGSGTTYTVAVSNMTTIGTVIASINAGVATDAAGNLNTASTSVDNTVTYNTNAPIASINLQVASDSGISSADNITNATALVFDVAFDESVSGLANNDFTNAGTAGMDCTFAVAGSGSTYTVTVSSCSEGTLILRLAAGAVTNVAAVPNGLTNGPVVTIDRTGPNMTVNQAAGQNDPTNASPIDFTVVFNEPVAGFATGDVTLSGTASGTLTGTVTETAPNNGTTYTVSVSGMTSDGTVIADIAAAVGTVTDVAGNTNNASTSTDKTVTYDTVAPTVTINQAGGQADPTNASPINFTVVFSESVTGFATGDVTLSGTAGATTATVTAVNSTTYNVAVSGMTASGTVIANIAAGKATDLAGNDNAASTTSDNTVTYDITHPDVTVEQAAGQADPTDVSPIHFTVTFSKPVTGFVAADVVLSSGTATVNEIAPNDGTTYDISVTGMSQGVLTASVPAGRAVDAVGNTNTASTSTDNKVTYDTIIPTVTINQATTQLDPTNVSPIHFTVTFSEAVSGFTGANVTLSSGIATVTGGPTLYDVSVAGMAQGVLTASIPAGVATDDVGHANLASTSTDNSVLYDTLAPSVTVTQEASQPDPTNTSPIYFTVVFSEPVTGFNNADLVFSGTAAPSTAVITTGSGTTYTVAVSGMATNGTVILNVPAGAAQDGTGNGNTLSAGGDNIVTYDTIRPTVTINQAGGQADPTNVSPINFTVTFSEPVTGFTDTDVRLTGTAGPTTVLITGSGATYNVAVSGMVTNGTVIAEVLVNAAVDAAGNSSFSSTSSDNTVTYDAIAPTVTINQDAAQADPTGTSPINFAVVFSEPMNSATFTSVDINLTTGTAPGTLTAVITGGPTIYNVAVSGMTGSGTVIATILAGGVQDLAGNINAASTSVDNTVTYDATAPSVTVNQAVGQADPTNGLPINFTVTFSEPMTGFTSADALTTGSTAPGTLTAIVTGGGTTYNVAISGMTGSGTVIVTVPANAAVDTSGNGNTASTSTDNVVDYDVTASTVTINQAVGQADPTGISPITFDVIFSEPVSGFTGADITLTGAAGATTAVVSGGGTTYTVAVSGMSGSGLVIATVNAGAATDLANNASLASTSTDNQVTYDNSALSVTINQTGGQLDPTNAGPINFAVIFSKTVTDFAAADVNLLTGTAPGTLTATVTGSGTTYNVAVSGMTGSGTVIATIPAGGVHDTAGNGNANSTSTDNTVTYDVMAPTVTINQAVGQADPTNTSPINFTVVFSEPVTGFATGDVSFTGSTAGGTLVGTVTEIAPNNGTTYNVAVTGMTSNGTVIALILAGKATDAAGNANAASTSGDNSVTFDNAALTVTINQAAGQLDPTNVRPINFTVVFSKPVTGFANADVVLIAPAGATATVSGASGGTTYNVAVTGMTTSGTVTASILAGAAQDASGTSSAASTSTDNTVTYDVTLPTVTINQAAGQVDPTNTAPINFTVIFSETVTGFTAADVTLSGAPGTLAATVTFVSGNTYNVAVNGMTGSGTVVATIAAGGVQDLAGNNNTDSTSTDNTVTYDVTAPTVTINQAAGQVDPTSASPINFTVVFSEPVTGFTNAGVVLSGTATGTITAAVTGSGTTYNVAVSGMTGAGTVIASISAGAATDAAGNTSAVSSSTDNTVTFDNVALTVTINQAAGQADPTNVRPINFTVVFSKPVTGFANADVVLLAPAGATATVTGVSGGTTYNVAVTGMTTSGTVTASILAGAAQDATNTSSAASTSTDNTVTYDVTLPAVTINQAAGQVDPTNAAPINFTVVFSEPVTGFAAADVALSGAPGTLAATVTLVSGNTYNVAVNGMTGSGTVVATIAAGGVQDLAGNTNTGSTSTDNAVTYDVTAPTVTINQALGQADPTNSLPIDFTVVFSEPVTGFAGADVTLTGTASGTLTALVTGSGTTYNVAVSGVTGSGTVIASIAAGAATDAAGNTSAIGTTTDNTVTYDIAILSVTINQAGAQADPTNGSPINFTVIFSKSVTGFTGTDVSLTGTAGANTAVVTGTGTTYNVAVSGMANSGTVIATIPANVAVDASNNPNLASSSADNTVTYDVAIPTVTINRAVAQADPTNTSPINFTVVFSEPVTGFTNAGVALSGSAGATTVVVTGTGATYNVAVSGMTNSGTVIATVAAGNAQDAAGNSNANSTSTDNNVQYDATAPTVTINEGAAQADPTNVSPIIFDVVFSKSVTGFTSADVTLGGTAGAATAVVTGSGTTYSVAVSGMTGDGTVTASIAAGVAVDTVGNPNTASTSTDNTVLYGLTAPSVTINQAVGQADPTSISPINFVVVFSKTVTGFTNADVSLSGTAAATTVVVTGSGANYNVAVSGMTLPGTVIATIPAGAALDTTGNSNTASTSTDNSVLYDVTAPTVTINQAAGQLDPSNTSPISFTVVFSETVTGFTGADVSLTGSAGATTAVVTGSGTTYTVAVSGMTASGTVIATIPAGNAQDVAGNGNANSTSTDNSVNFDFTAPSVTINQAAGQADPTNASPIIFDVLFSKSVTGFANADVTLGGTAGATTAVVAGTGTTYTVTVTGMASNGTVTASIPAGVVTDSVGNTNTVSTSTDNTVTYDTVGPTVTINQAAAQADPTGTSPINFTVMFSEPVTGFTNADLNVAGTAGPTTAVVTGSGTTYNVAVSGMSVTGTVFVTIADSAGTDAAGNPSAASTSTDNTVTYDTGAPTVTVNQAASQVDPTNVATINFTVVFNKPVFNFVGADVTLTGTAGATTAVVTGTGPTYNVAASGMSGSGTVIASIQAGRAQDIAGNNNLASTSTDNTVTYDISAPTATINQAAAQADPTNNSPVNFTVEFSETVFGFTSADITLGGTAGATTAVITGGGTTYNVAVSGMVTDGTITAALGDGVVTDVTGNANTAATSTDNEVTYNTTNPTVLVEKAAGQADPTNLPTIDFTVTFSELVVGFTNTDVVLGGTAGANNVVITGAGPVYTVTVSGMTNDGTVTVSIPAGAVTDPSSNPNPASIAVTITYLDGVGPSVQLVNTTPETADHVLSSPETVAFDITQFKVQFNQPVFDPQGDSAAEDVTNPNNYMLLRDLGDTGGLQTVSCVAGAAVPADTQIAIGTVTYDSLTYTATFTVNGGLPLSNGDYHLFVCGTTSIVDPLNNALALVGSSGQGGTDYRHSFTVRISGNGGGGGGNEDNDGAASTAKSTLATTGFLIPVTGFSPNEVTMLPVQPENSTYSSMDNITIEIPSLGIKFPIVGVSVTDTGWNLTWLKDNVGYLENSAYPTFNGNTVLTAHVRDANKNLGPFSDIKGLQLGDKILLHAYGKVYVYEVQENTKISPNDISTAFKHEEYSWVTLVTCEDYNAKIEEYYHRRMVRAVLISVIPER